MKKFSCLAVLLLIVPSLATAKVDSWLKFKLNAYLSGKHFALLRVGGIPSLPPGGVLGQGITVLIHDGGEWRQKTTMGMKRATHTFLEKFELLEINDIDFHGRGITLTTDTFRKLATDKPGKYLHHQTRFKFSFNKLTLVQGSDDNLGFIIHCLEKYFHFAATPEEAREAVPVIVPPPPQPARELPKNIEIRMGMTRDEVEDMLGAPQTREFTGTRMICGYKAFTVIYENDRVAAIRF